MKKILITLVIVLSLTASAFAGSMSDVPSNHWAYEAVNTLVAAGLIQGYPDGTFQGQNELTRYEVSVMLARLLEDIESERGYMLEEIDFNTRKAVHESERALSDAQKDEVEAAVKALLEENTPEIPEAEVTDEDVDEVLAVIEDLVYEFESELEAQGLAVDVLVDEFSDVENRVSELEAQENYTSNVNFSGEYSVNYEEFKTDGEGTVYADPYNPVDDDGDVLYEGDDILKQAIDLNMAVNNGPLAIDLDLGASTDNFNTVEDENTLFDLQNYSAVITGDEFVATIKEDQAPGLKSYLLSDKTDDDGNVYGVNGVVVDAEGNTYAIVYNPENDRYILAGNGEFAVLGQAVNVAYGTENLATETSVVAFDTEMDLYGFTVTPELALNEANLDNKFFTLGANGELAEIELDFNYANITEGFTPIAGDDPAAKRGFDVTGNTSVLFADVEASYASYDGDWDYNNMSYEVEVDGQEENDVIEVGSADSVMEVKGEMAEEFAGYDIEADASFRTFTGFAETANRKEWNVKATNEFGKLAFEGNLNNVKETEQYGEIMKATDKSDEYDEGDYNEADDFFNKSAKLTYSVSDALTTSSLFEFDSANDLTTTLNSDYEAGKLAATAELSMPGFEFTNAKHKYTADYTISDALKAGAEFANTDAAENANWRSKFYANYAQSIYTADVTKFMNDGDNTDDMILEGTVKPDSVNVFDVAVSPYAEAGYKISDVNASNYALGVDAEKTLNERATLTGNYEYANKNFNLGDKGLAGVRVIKGLGLDYQITSDLNAGLDYEALDFTDAEEDVRDYSVRKASAGIDLAF